MILPIPAYTPDELGLTLYKLMQLTQIVGRSSDTDIVIDLSKTKFLNCVYLTGLFNLIRQWSENGRSVQVQYGECEIAQYLNTIHFEDGFNVYKSPTLAEDLTFYNNKRYTPIVVFPTTGTTRESCVSTVLDVIHTQTNIKGVLRIAVDYFVSELTNNVAEHSECMYGTIFAQCYKSKGYIDICIADNGIGLWSSYKKSDKFNPKAEAEAVEMAINGRSTKDLPESRGFGLSTSKNMIVDGLGGTFFLWTGETLLIESKSTRSILAVDHGVYFKGCIITLRLPLKAAEGFNFYDYVER